MYKQRLKVFFLLAVLAVVAAGARLLHLQGAGGQEYRRRGQDMLCKLRFLPTCRGQILDRAGRILAFDEACYDFCLDYPMLIDAPPKAWLRQQAARLVAAEGLSRDQARAVLPERIEQTWQLAEQISGVPRNELARAAQRAARRIEAIRDKVGMPVSVEDEPQTILAGLDESQALALRANLERMIGASMQPSHRRRYPYGPAACHLIGTLRQQGPGSEASRPETSAQGDEPPAGDDGAALRERLTGYFEGDLIGRDGVERLCEDMLRGRRGYIRTQKSTGQLLEEVPAEYGREVRLTVDIELQRALSALLERNGAIVVLDVPSGQVLAMVSRPTYDLNEYGKLYDQLSRDEIELPLWDRTVAMRFAPGSTIKPLAALAGLTEKAITPETVFECRGYLHRPGEFECYHKLVHGSISLLAALEQSCNVFFYNVGERLGVRRLNDWLTRFGYADAPGTHLPGEARGILPNPQRARAVGDARRLAIGQGLVVTPMHVANAMATIARDGVWLSPVVVAELAERQQERRLDLPASALETVREGMRRVVNAPSGTAYKTARLGDLEFSGKTGTAETPPLWHDANGNRRVDEGEEVYKSGDTAWFVGFAPSKNPQLAFAVMLEYSQQAGGAICAPIGKQVVQVCRQFGYLK